MCVPLDAAVTPCNAFNLYVSPQVLLRLEINAAAGMCRASVRAGSPQLVASVVQLVHSQLAAPGA